MDQPTRSAVLMITLPELSQITICEDTQDQVCTRMLYWVDSLGEKTRGVAMGNSKSRLCATRDQSLVFSCWESW